MSNRSNVDVALEIVQNVSEPISFAELWSKILEIQGLNPEEAANKVGAFYTSLLLDGRFINVGDNTWDLRTRYTFEKATLDTKDCYTEDEDEEELDPEEANEEKGDSDDSDDKSEEDDEDSEKKESSEDFE